MSVEQGRAMVARARVYRTLEWTGIVASGLAIPLFAASYLELRDIDLAVLAGGEGRVPYFAWSMIALFVAGTVLAFVMRHLVRRISAALEAEQRRRWVDGHQMRGAGPGDGRSPEQVTGGSGHEDDAPAVAG